MTDLHAEGQELRAIRTGPSSCGLVFWFGKIHVRQQSLIPAIHADSGSADKLGLVNIESDSLLHKTCLLTFGSEVRPHSKRNQLHMAATLAHY